MHEKRILRKGSGKASKALVMIHGRGGTAEDILSLSEHLNVKDYALLAPQATNHTWYPFSFMAAPQQNEPWLSSALNLLSELVADLEEEGITEDHIYFLGFSQGACLTLEFAARHPARYGGVVAFTGGLIGDKIYPTNYHGSFAGTPVFIGTSDPDPHVPVERVHATTEVFKAMQADVTEVVYAQMGHTISSEEIIQANKLIFKD